MMNKYLGYSPIHEGEFKHYNINVKVKKDCPEPGYFTAQIGTGPKGTARSEEKAVAFALVKLADEVKSEKS